MARNQAEATQYLDQLRSRSTRPKRASSSAITSRPHCMPWSSRSKPTWGLLSAHGISSQIRGPYGDVASNLIAYGTTPLVIMQEGSQTPTMPTPIEVANDEPEGQ